MLSYRYKLIFNIAYMSRLFLYNLNTFLDLHCWIGGLDGYR